MMGLLIALIVVFVVISVASYFADIDAPIMVGGMATTIVLVPLMLFSLGCQTSLADPTKTPIYAIKDNSNIEGSFSLGFGQVNEEQYYYFVTSDENGFKGIEKLPVEESFIKEGEVDQPYLLTFKERFDSAFARFMYGEFSGDETYVFYVPENTITTEFNIDLE